MSYDFVKDAKSVGELKEILKDVPDNYKVLLYIEETEDYGSLDNVEVYPNGTEEERMPYGQADIPETELPFILLA